MENKKTSNQELRPFRVTIESIDYFTVDVIARSPSDAISKAETIDPDYVTHLEKEGVYEATDAKEIPAHSFEPPSLPAAAWAAE